MVESVAHWPARPVRVLVWPGGTEVGLEIHRSLAWAKEVELISGGAFGGGHAPLVFGTHCDIPHVDDPSWPARLDAVLQEFKVDAIVPAHDDVLVALARLRRPPTARVVGSRPSAVETCRSKRATYAALCGVVPSPALLDPTSSGIAFPAFARPDRSQGSQGAMVLRDKLDLAFALAHGSDVVTTYLPGRECTVDCFSSRDGHVIYSLARTRDRVRNGISVSSAAVVDQQPFRDMAVAIQSTLGLRGAWFFQTRDDAAGVPHLLEVAPRIAGTMAVSRLRGVNLPLLALYDAFGVSVEVRPLDVDVRVERALAERVANPLMPTRVYVDLDDTLLLRGHVNEHLVMVLARLRSRGTRIEVITRHATDPNDTLARAGLSSLFDHVHHLTGGEPKSAVVVPAGAVFIDDSFVERREVANTHAIPTLDCSMLGLIYDGRA